VEGLKSWRLKSWDGRVWDGIVTFGIYFDFLAPVRGMHAPWSVPFKAESSGASHQTCKLRWFFEGEIMRSHHRVSQIEQDEKE
jgi:hypothetical protein